MDMIAADRRPTTEARSRHDVLTKFFYRGARRDGARRIMVALQALFAIAPGHRPLDEFSAAKLDDLGLTRAAVGVPDDRDLRAIRLRP